MIKKYKDGGVYNGDGTFLTKKREGKGEMRYANGDVYTGDWKDDVRCGSGRFKALRERYEYNGEWANDTDVHVHLTIDREQEGWDGHVGFVPNYVKELGFDTNKTAVLCGPPIMIKFTLEGLCALGFDKTQVYTTLELRMKCGIGKCGRCNVGSKYVCKDGPVFRCDELDELPDEY